MSEAGKGSSQRPTDHEAFSKAFERIFGKKPSDEQQKAYEQQKESAHEAIETPQAQGR
jgi:uncharacterized protein with von Willebrand factor type A (vWA) domain